MAKTAPKKKGAAKKTAAKKTAARKRVAKTPSAAPAGPVGLRFKVGKL